MTTEALIEEAKKFAKTFATNPEAGMALKMVPKIRTVDAVVIYFESDQHDGKIEVVLDKDSGKFISATMSPRDSKKKP